jgi:hypothetical protein
VTDIERSVEGVGKPATFVARARACSFALLASLAVACAGKSTPKVDSAQREEKSYYDESSSSSSHSEPAEKSEKSGDDSSESMTRVKNQEPPEPVFTEGMSVDEAIKAVPPGIERRNIDQETLGKPLQDLSLYESCKPAHFKARVAVWNGKAVGVDITTTPKNDKVLACLKDKIQNVTWEKKVKSLNTFEYQF